MDSAGAIFVFIVFTAIIVAVNRLIRKGVSAGVNKTIDQIKKRL